MDYASKMLEAESMRLKPKSMNALQQSFTFQGGRLSESMLSHPTIKEIEPLFRSIQEALRTWVHSKAEVKRRKEKKTPRTPACVQYSLMKVSIRLRTL